MNAAFLKHTRAKSLNGLNYIFSPNSYRPTGLLTLIIPAILLADIIVAEVLAANASNAFYLTVANISIIAPWLLFFITAITFVVQCQRRQREQKKLKSIMAEIQKCDHMKNTFLANISHELRTPMTSILGQTDILLMSGTAPAKYQKAAQSIRQHGQHLLHQVNEIIEFAQLESGYLAIDSTPTQLETVIYDVFGQFQDTVTAKGLILKIEYATPIAHTVMTDSVRLKQILSNLLSSTIQFTHTGCITLKVSYVAPTASNTVGQLQFTIENNDSCSTPKDESLVFEPFSRANTWASTSNFGLRLVIADKLISLLHGTLKFACSSHGGCFIIEMPVKNPSSATISPTDLSTMLTKKNHLISVDASRLKDVRILIAEDQPDIQMLVTYILKKYGAIVEVAGNGLIAIKQYRDAIANEQPFDLIMMDMHMPEMDGCTAVQMLREMGCDVPIFAMTADATENDLTNKLKGSCDAFLTKPIRHDVLVATCEKLLKRQPPISK